MPAKNTDPAGKLAVDLSKELVSARLLISLERDCHAAFATFRSI